MKFAIVGILAALFAFGTFAEEVAAA